MSLTSSIQAKLSIIIGCFVVCILATVGSTLFVVWSQSADASVIDIAGRQRTLVVQMEGEAQRLIAALESESSTEEARRQLAASVSLFDGSLAALKEGGSATDGAGAQIELPASEGAAWEHLAKVEQGWSPASQALDVILGTDVDITSDAFYDAGEVLAAAWEPLLAGSGEAALALKEVSERKLGYLETTLGSALLASLAVAVLSIVFARRQISAPLAKLAETIRNVERSSDLSLRCDARSSDELGRMAADLNSMLQTFGSIIGEVTNSATQLDGATDQLIATAGDMKSQASSASAQAEAATSGSEHVNESLGTMAASTEEMTSTIAEISRNTTEASSVTRRAVDVAAKTDVAITKLGDASTKIGDVVKVITSIAEQTNLLALNATIEAARAGEAGKGFAVVATEVKELAKETASATEEISARISAIQDDSRGAIESVNEIREVIGKIDEIAGTIAAAVEEQTATTNEISQNVGAAARGSSEVNSSIGGATEAARGTAKGAEEASAACVELGHMSTRLRELVERFTV